VELRERKIVRLRRMGEDGGSWREAVSMMEGLEEEMVNGVI